MTLEQFLNGPNPTKNENRKIAEFLVNSVKAAFLVIQNGKTQPFFSRYQLSWCVQAHVRVLAVVDLPATRWRAHQLCATW